MNNYRFIDEKIEKTVDRYISRIITESTPDAPVWNIERIRHNRKPAWNYIDGCMISCLISLYGQTQERRLFDFAEKFVDYYVAEDGSILGYDPSEYNIDNISPGRVLFDLYEVTKKEKYKKAIELIYSQLKTHPRTAEGNFWHKKIYPNQVWLDGLYMGQVFYIRYETAFNACRNYDDILRQFENVRKYMFDSEKKLYYHGYDASKSAFWADPVTGLSKSFWLRSMGWYITALADILEYIKPDEFKMIVRLQELLREAIEGILQYIDLPTRMFFQVPDKKTEKGNYPETSGSAMIAYAVMKAVRLNVVTSGYLHTGRGIFNGICKKYLTETDGKLHLGGICLSAGLGPENNTKRDGTAEYYFSEPVVEDDAKGLGPFLMAYTEMKKIK